MTMTTRTGSTAASGSAASCSSRTSIPLTETNTGNAWAAKGMLQVAAAIERSHYKSSMAPQLTDLKNWVQEILDGVFPSLRSDGLLPNYLYVNSTFGDASGSAALAAVAYRAKKLWPSQFKNETYLTTAGRLILAP